MYRFFGRWMKTMLATTALLASQHLPFYAILCLPILFTAGMTLMDTFDGVFMNFAYSWAFFNLVRKVYYNLAITGLSVAIYLFIGTIEVLGLLPTEIPSLTGGFWNYMANFDINKAGFVIVGMFIVTWAAALMFWKFGHVEEKWNARLKTAQPGTTANGDS
jgi:high-affinity nickel-transport protein